MADITVRYFSGCLKRRNTFGLYLPNDFQNDSPWEQQDRDGAPRRMKTLFLLHGYSSNAWNWVPEQLCREYGIAVVTPEGENGFWLDGLSTGHKYCTMLGEEMISYLRSTFGLAKSREDTCLLGFSMGGFGALHTGLAYPEVFGRIGAMSSALIVHEVAGMTPGSGNGIANYEYYRECFGEPSAVLESTANPEFLADRLLAEGRRLPEIYMCCGTEDFLLENNRQFHRFLESRSIPHEYRESPGTHDMPFWNEYTEKIIRWMFG